MTVCREFLLCLRASLAEVPRFDRLILKEDVGNACSLRVVPSESDAFLVTATLDEEDATILQIDIEGGDLPHPARVFCKDEWSPMYLDAPRAVEAIRRIIEEEQDEFISI